MSAYMIFIREEPVRDQAEMDTYRKKGAGSQNGFNMKPLAVYGAQEAIEGKAPDGVVILEFPTMEEAKAWYNSPIYKSAAPHRMKAAHYRTVLVQGFEGQ